MHGRNTMIWNLGSGPVHDGGNEIVMIFARFARRQQRKWPRNSDEKPIILGILMQCSSQVRTFKETICKYLADRKGIDRCVIWVFNVSTLRPLAVARKIRPLDLVSFSNDAEKPNKDIYLIYTHKRGDWNRGAKNQNFAHSRNRTEDLLMFKAWKNSYE